MPGRQDAVRSYKPSIPVTYLYRLKPGESFYKDRNGKVTIIRSKNELVSKDTRNDLLKLQDSKNASNIRKLKQMALAKHKTALVVSNILDRVRPSKVATAIVKGLKLMDYVDNGNEGTGNELANTGFDILSTFGTNALFSMSKFPKLNLINLLTKATEESTNLGLFNLGRLALMRRYRQNPPKYTGVHEGGHMSTMNYNPANEKAKAALYKLTRNANKLAKLLEIDPQKNNQHKENINKKGLSPEQADKRTRGLAAQEWMQDNHSVEVPLTMELIFH